MVPPDVLDAVRATAWKNIPTIASELTEILPARKMGKFKIPDANMHMTRKRSRVEARILELASEVTNAKYTAKSYSNFHVWEAFRHVKTKKAARAIAPDLAASMHPFGNCLTMASECAEELRAALKAEGPEYAEYVGRVQFVTNNWTQRARSSRDYHCMAIVRLPTQCIVVDPVNCGTAFAVPLGEVYAPAGCSSVGYVYVASGDARLLVECGAMSPCYTLARPYSQGVFQYDDPFADVKDGLAGGVQNLAFPSTNYHLKGKLPSRRTVFVHQVWKQKPKVPYVELASGKGFVVETCLLRVDFVMRKITVELIPYVDWLMRPEYAGLLDWLRGRNEVTLPENEGMLVKISVFLGGQGTDRFDAETVQSLDLLDEVCGKLGMPEGEVLRIAGVMQEVWAEHDEAEGKQAGRQRKGVRGRAERVAAKVTTQPYSREDGKVQQLRNTEKSQAPYPIAPV